MRQTYGCSPSYGNPTVGPNTRIQSGKKCTNEKTLIPSKFLRIKDEHMAWDVKNGKTNHYCDSDDNEDDMKNAIKENKKDPRSKRNAIKVNRRGRLWPGLMLFQIPC